MKTRTIEDFFLKELTDYSCYSTIRMLGSAIDGLKNSQRKIIYTALDKLKSSTKVSVFDNQMQSYTQYLHGSASGVVSNMGASYCGSNNLPLLKGEGNFGSRMVNEPAAPRYIYVNKPDYLDSIFDIRDVLIEQSFEGDKIEPKFFVPSIPLALVNGCMNGLASGFKQHILPRDLKDIVKYYESQNSTKVKNCGTNVKFLNPYIKGFNGSILNDMENPNKWYLCGKVSISKNKVHITEIPPFIEYSKYIETLDDLLDKKKIKSYKDNTNVKTQTFDFEVVLHKELNESNVLDLLKLKRSEVEIYNCIDENNKVRTFENVFEILDYFKKVRTKYLELQRQYDLKQANTELFINASKYKFVQMIMNNELKVFKRPKDDIVKDLSKTNLFKDFKDNEVSTKVEDFIKFGVYDYLLNMQIHSFTNETLKILESKIEKLQDKIKNLKELNIETKFLNDMKGLL